MAETTVATENELVKFQRDFYKEYVRESGFMPYMGSSFNNPFVVQKDLLSGGRDINIPLVNALQGEGTGAGTLVGNEENLDNHGYQVKPVWRRNAVTTKKSERHKSSIDLLRAGKDMLKIWSMDDFRDKIIDGLDAIAEDSSAFDEATGHGKQVTFAEASTAQKNAYSAANQYRILYGDSEANYSATMATGLGAVTSAMTFGAAELSLMKMMAKRRNKTNGIPSIRPIRVNNGTGREYFIAFCGQETFADFKADSVITAANRDARPRDVSANPLFQDGDLIYDGVIVREIPEIDDSAYATVGDGSGALSPVYLCGAQALGIAWGQMTRATTRKEDDYGFITGVGTEELRGVEKLFYDSHGNTGLQHGMITGFFAK